jgi:hypothetical protein
MKTLFKEYLFTKHILVSEVSPKTGEKTNSGKGGGKTAEARDTRLETLFSLANLFNIRITEGEELVQEEMISFAEKQLGTNVPAPFYRGFPESVRRLSPDQLLFDQLVHYTITYGFGNFSEAGHSILEEKLEKIAFKEETEIRDFRVLAEDDAIALLKDLTDNLLCGTRPLSDSQYALVKSVITDFDYQPKQIASKNTTVKLLLDTRSLNFTEYLSLSDVVKLVDELNYQLYQNTHLNKLNLKNQDRKFITAVIDKLIAEGKCDLRNCYEKKKTWNGLLHHIHYVGKSKDAKTFLSAMRGNENHSVYSAFEKSMTEKNISEAVAALRKGKGSGAILRNLNYILSRCESPEDTDALLSSLDTKNTIVLLQLLLQYAQYKKGSAPRTFTFSKYNLMKVHTETAEEMNHRRSVISEGQAQMLANRLTGILRANLKDRLGKVYIDPEMKRYALPIAESTSQGGFGVLTRGTRLPMRTEEMIKEGKPIKKLRGFTYWEKVNDIDLSVFGIDTEGNRKEFSWRTMAGNQSEAITYSGDETSGFNGGSEYFDVDLPKFRDKYPGMRYLIFCDNVYSALTFDKCFCRAGYMLRDTESSGEIYEPKTVQSAYTVNCNSTFAYLFGIDLETEELIWLNMARSGSTHVAGNTDMNFITDYFHITDVVNVYSFFEMMAAEMVATPEEAEIIVTNKTMETKKDVEIIREYDTERMIQLMNQ